MIRAAFLVTMLLASAGAGAAVPELWGNVGSDGETGDIGGFEIAIHDRGPRPWAEFVQCQGDCAPIERVALRRTRDGYVFRRVAHRAGGDDAVTRVTLRRTGRSLTIAGHGADGFAPERLRPLGRRVGLAIARDYR